MCNLFVISKSEQQESSLVALFSAHVNEHIQYMHILYNQFFVILSADGKVVLPRAPVRHS